MGQESTPSLGSWIRASRERLGWTQAELGRLFGVTQATVSHWENGRMAPGEEERTRMEELFGGAPEQLEIPGAEDLTARHREGGRVATAGLVINRQRPSSANSVTFVTLEDETEQLNLIVWKRLAERQRQTLLGARLLGVVGELQREGRVIHVIAQRLEDHSELLGGLVTRSRDFR